MPSVLCKRHWLVLRKDRLRDFCAALIVLPVPGPGEPEKAYAYRLLLEPAHYVHL